MGGKSLGGHIVQQLPVKTDIYQIWDVLVYQKKFPKLLNNSST